MKISLQQLVFHNVCVFVCRFAGILLGITNTFATIPGMVGPVIASQLTKSVRKCSICIHASSSCFLRCFQSAHVAILINSRLRSGSPGIGLKGLVGGSIIGSAH